MKHLFFLSLILSLFITTVLGQKQEAKYTASFVAEWANDTACIETFTIAGNHLFGKAIHLFPEPHLRQFQFWFQDDGSLKTLDIQFYNLQNTSIPLESKTGFLPYRISMIFNNGVIDFRTVNKEGEKQYLHSAPRMDFFGGWIPIFGQWEWLAWLTNGGKASTNLKFVNYVVGVYELEMEKLEGQSTVLFKTDISPIPIPFKLDQQGKIVSIDAMGSPWNFAIHKREALDVEAFTKAFAKKPIVGDPSPHQTLSESILGANINFSYGRPSKRGREIFGNVVPYNIVWRTGAGPVTRIAFDKDLNFQGTIVPKGTYNIFTIPGKSSWTLIFNTEENAWGSAHHAEFDFKKVEMKSISLSQTVDQFTIKLLEKDEKGVLQMSWDKTMAKVHFEVRE